MTYSGLYATSNEFLGLGLETVRGTAVAPTWWLPMSSPSWDPKVSWLKDDGFRGDPVDNYGSIPGVRYDELGFKHYLYADTILPLLVAALGGSDTVVGDAAPYAHTVGLFNNAAYGSQPPSFTVVWFDGYKARQLAGCQLDSLNLTFAADGKIEVASKWICDPESEVDAPTPDFTDVQMAPGWDYALSLSDSTVVNSISGELDIQRNTKSVFTGGAQAPFQNFASKLSANGKLTFGLTSDDTTLATGLTYAPQAATLTFTNPAADTTETTMFQMSALQIEDPSIKPGKEYVDVTANFDTAANSTDAVDTGNSPILCVVTNAVEAPTYTEPT